jgi:hypothetical protein
MSFFVLLLAPVTVWHCYVVNGEIGTVQYAKYRTVSERDGRSESYDAAAHAMGLSSLTGARSSCGLPAYTYHHHDSWTTLDFYVDAPESTVS